MPAAGGPAVQVTRSGGRVPLGSPDGKYLYFIKSDTSSPLFRMPVEGGKETQVVAQVVPLESFAVTAKGVYFASLPDLRLQFLDTATGKLTVLAAVPSYGGGLCVSPDERYVVWAQVDRNTADLMLVENFR